MQDRARWTVVIPYFNEEGFLPATLESLAAQTLRPFALVLVDNGSTDRSAALAARWAAAHPGIDTRLIAEPQPGQVHALARGMAAVRTPYVAIADADTRYPPHYLQTADRLLGAAPADVVGYVGHDMTGDPRFLSMRGRRWFYSHVAPLLMPNQVHGGGYAHCLRTDAMRRAGGYAPEHWPYVLKDHELAHRLWKQGRIAMHPDLWVIPSGRRADRSGVRWTLFERILYHATPPAAKDWYWYRFMARRFAARGQKDTVLRRRGWEDPAATHRPSGPA